MLKRLRLTDFKSFVDEAVDFAPLTLLVGANASGKSNCLDALHFLRELIRDLSVSDILDGEQGLAAWQEPSPGIRGGSAGACRIGTSSFTIESTWATPPFPEEDLPARESLVHRIRCRTQPDPDWIEEGIYSGEAVWLEVTEAQEGTWTAGSVWRGPAGPVKMPSRTGCSILWQVPWTVLTHYPLDAPGVEVLGLALHEAFQRIYPLDIRPERMRGYGQMKRPQLAPDGSNFSGALAHLCESSEEKQAIVDWLTELLAPEIADIDFVGVKELGDVMAILVEKDGKRVPARGLSDGTLRFLGLLLALRTAEPGSLFLIEDIDSGLHPARVHVLVEFLEALVRERDVQVIATTHAPVVLQALSRETLLSAVVFGRVPGHEGTLMRRLGDLPHFEEALARKGIDELFATGWLEMAL
ncbi:MAG TPA: AAA family ATPase [Polyangia bacterium]|jgi:hypothetical protein|nr:AAA family ATPase [Polyangia bacterium]